jgi:hypothetical protein
LTWWRTPWGAFLFKQILVITRWQSAIGGFPATFRREWARDGAGKNRRPVSFLTFSTTIGLPFSK